MPDGGLFCFQMSLVLFSCDVLMDADVSVDVEGNVLLQVDRFGGGSVMV